MTATTAKDVSAMPLPTLSDDELVALMVSEEESYRPTSLPTVDVDNRDAVVAAALRGERSLGIRGLLGASEADSAPELVELAGVLRDQPPLVSLYVGDAQYRRLGFVLCNLWRSWEGDQWLRHVLSPVGAHAFEVQDRRDVGDDLAALALRALHGDENTSPDAPMLCIAIAGGAGTQILGVRKGAAEMVRLSASGEPGVARAVPDSALAAEVRTLLAGADVQP